MRSCSFFKHANFKSSRSNGKVTKTARLQDKDLFPEKKRVTAVRKLILEEIAISNIVLIKGSHTQ